METSVLAFLYSLLMSMGLIGASYSDIAYAFPDNTAQQNSVLYSIANNPTQNTGGFLMEYLTDPNMLLLTNPEAYYLLNVNPTALQYWSDLMDELGYAIVGNNVNVAVSQGYNPSPDALNYIGTLEATNGEKIICTFVGCANTMFRNVDRIPDGISVSLGVPNYDNYVGDVSVFRWQYDDTVVYSTSRLSDLSTYISVRIGDVVRFEVVNNVLRFRVYRSGMLYWDVPYSKDYWINQGIPINDALVFDPTESVMAGADSLSFGETDNPVIGVEYDPLTGVTTYKYKDGTISTSPPATLSDTISLSPSITQPLTNYIINEGDITNIYNPDSAIPSDSSIPFDFTSLGDLLYKEFTPVTTFDFKPPYNRFLNKYDWETPFKKICQKFNITGRRPSYILSFVWFGESVSFDVWCWCDYLLDSRGYNLYMKFMKFFLYFGMITGCLFLFLRSINVKLGTVIVSKG